MPPNIENFYFEESPPKAARQQQSGAAPLKDLYFSGDFCEVMRNEQKKRSRVSGTPHKQKYRSPKARDRRERTAAAVRLAERSGEGGDGDPQRNERSEWSEGRRRLAALVAAARVSRAGQSEV